MKNLFYLKDGVFWAFLAISSVFCTISNAKTIEIDDDLAAIAENFRGISISGQATTVYQTSDLRLKSGDLKLTNGNDVSDQNLQSFNHDDAGASFSADLVVEKKFSDREFFQIDLQFASGQGVDANLQSGTLVNNEIMEDPNRQNSIYLARAFYERSITLPHNYEFTIDVGRFAVNDYFDVNDETSDQRTQFLNQAIATNGAFDFAQDLDNHGYSYGVRTAIGNKKFAVDLGLFSGDSYLNNISDKYSMLAALTLTPNFAGKLPGKYQFYVFSNQGEYAAFDDNGLLLSKNVDADGDGAPDNINNADNADDLNKNGFGFSASQAVSDKINIFAKFGIQDDDRDARHNQDQDQGYMFGANFSGDFWGRKDDQLGVAIQVARLTGNHRKAHERGYASNFNRLNAGIGQGNYRDQTTIEAYYRLALSKNSSLSADYQYLDNYYYSKLIGGVSFLAARLNVNF